MRKKLKLLTIFAVALTLVFTTTITASAASVKLNKSKATLYVGQTVTLKVQNTSNTVKWSTSKKSVATVSAKGKVTAKKAGTAKITAKVNGKKYTCKITVKNKVGTRQNPADAWKGVTYSNFYGKAYFKLNNVWRHEDAINQLKSMGEWSSYKEWAYADKDVDTDVLLMEFEAEAKSGFEETALSGSDIMSSYSVYNEKANAAIDDFETWSMGKNGIYDFSLFNGGSGTVYYCALVPNDVNVFTRFEYDKNFDKYWIKYDIGGSQNE